MYHGSDPDLCDVVVTQHETLLVAAGHDRPRRGRRRGRVRGLVAEAGDKRKRSRPSNKH